MALVNYQSIPYGSYMLHVAIAERQGLTALLGATSIIISAEGRWHVEDWLSIAVETMGSAFSDLPVYHCADEDGEHWLFVLADVHMTPGRTNAIADGADG